MEVKIKHDVGWQFVLLSFIGSSTLSSPNWWQFSNGKMFLCVFEKKNWQTLDKIIPCFLCLGKSSDTLPENYAVPQSTFKSLAVASNRLVDNVTGDPMTYKTLTFVLNPL